MIITDRFEIAMQITLKAIEEKAIFSYTVQRSGRNEEVIDRAYEVNTFFNAVLENLKAQSD